MLFLPHLPLPLRYRRGTRRGKKLKTFYCSFYPKSNRRVLATFVAASSCFLRCSSATLSQTGFSFGAWDLAGLGVAAFPVSAGCLSCARGDCCFSAVGNGGL